MTSPDGINGWSIQTLLRGENDSKQSDEFQAKGNTEVIKFESVTVNFYSSTKTLQVQGSQKDQYVKKLRNIVEKGSKCQDTLIEVTPNSGSAEINY